MSETSATFYVGDASETLQMLPPASVQTCVTSPPYWGLRDYGEDGQLGLERSPEEYVSALCDVFDEVGRVLRDDGTVWLNIGDTYAGGGGVAGKPEGWNDLHDDAQYPESTPSRNVSGLKQKDLCMIPSRVAMELQQRGWWVRSRIVWAKPNPMPESVTDRPTSSHEYIFLLSKSKRYFYDHDAIREEAKKGHANSRFDTGKTNGHAKASGQEFSDGDRDDYGTRNKRDVWAVSTKPYSDAHFAVYPPDLIKPCLKAGSSKKGQCEACGRACERVVDHTPGQYDYSDRTNDMNGPRSRTQASGTQKATASRKTTGWQLSCDCDASDTEPQTVLDPFAGAGTTGLVAAKLGRDFIGIDISRDYCSMAASRLRRDVGPMFCDITISD
jgi:DNA modification methylase